MTVDLALAKAQVRVTSSAEDTLIAKYLAAAVSWVENYTSKKLTAATAVEETFASFPDAPYAFTLLWGPAPADAEVTYIDAEGEEQTITTGRLVNGKLYPPLSSEWPAIEANSSITVGYTAGYASVPAQLDLAVLLLVGEFYDNRNVSDISAGTLKVVSSYCAPFRTPTLR